MTDDDKKKLIKVFLTDAKKAEPEETEDGWSEEEILAVAEKIMKRIGISETAEKRSDTNYFVD